MTIDLATFRKAPKIRLKGAELFLNLFYNLRVLPDAVDLVLIPDDSLI